ncbi:endo-1,4-beta-xylanase [Cellulosilyticum ruminicola]
MQQKNNVVVRGHVFTWHSQTPNWFFKENFSKDPAAPNASKEVMLQRLENYIKSVFETVQKEYLDVEFYAWDIVNEAINPDTPNGMCLPAEVAGITKDDGNNENEGKSM